MKPVFYLSIDSTFHQHFLSLQVHKEFIKVISSHELDLMHRLLEWRDYYKCHLRTVVVTRESYFDRVCCYIFIANQLKGSTSEIWFVCPLQLPIPLEKFTSPVEDSLPLLRLYFRALVTGALKRKWCPVFYVVAVSHLNAFIFSQDAVAEVNYPCNKTSVIFVLFIKIFIN